jgi:hypothetical protein
MSMSGMSKGLMRNKHQQRKREARGEQNGLGANTHGTAEVSC